jgi:hypothetical protein
MRGGARLETDGGRIDATDVVGALVTKGRRSNQRITLIRGDVDVDNLEGDVLLQQVTGNRVVARLLRGTLRADRVLARSISLSSMMGRVEFVLGEAGPIELRARARKLVIAGRSAPDSGVFHGVLGGGAAEIAQAHVELTSYGGDVWVSQVARTR